MKRIGNLYSKIYDMNNLILAYNKAKRGKSSRKDIKEFGLNLDLNLRIIQDELINHTYRTSKYHIFKLYENGKEREIYKLPFKDRVVQHAIMNILESIFVKTFISQTYNCIKSRGIHKGLFKLNEYLKDTDNTKYCLKFDINKFYPSINNTILKKLLRNKFKDRELLSLLDNIIDSNTGLPIGNYMSQYLANYYLAYFDH